MCRPSAPWLAVALLLRAGVLAAEPSRAELERADTLFAEGKAAMRNGIYDVACARFAESDQLDPAPGTLRNLAECEEKRGQLLAARRHLRDAIARRPKADILKLCSDQLEALERRIPGLTVRLPENVVQGSTVTLDGVSISDLGERIPVDPGKHILTLDAPGRASSKETVEVKEGDTARVYLVLGAPEAKQEDGPRRNGQTTGASSQLMAGYVAVGAGVAVGAAAVYFAYQQKSHWDAARASSSASVKETENDKGSQAGTYALVLGVTSGLAVATGLALVLTSPDGSNAARLKSPRIAVAIDGSGGRATIGGTW